MLVLLKISGFFELNYLAGANGRELGTERLENPDGFRSAHLGPCPIWVLVSLYCDFFHPYLGKTSYFD